MKTVAIVGASGLVGQRLVQLVADKLPQLKVRLFGDKSVGEKFAVGSKWITVEPCANLLLAPLPNYALFAANAETSQTYVPMLAKQGTVCVDNSAAFRLEPQVPLVVPSINGNLIAGANVVANPNCTTIQVAVTLAALTRLKPNKVVVATYQATSGAGKEGLWDLQNNCGYGKLKTFAHPIADNVLPKIGSVTNSGATEEEVKLQLELPKILNLPNLAVNSFCARVPVTTGHCAFVNVRFEKEICMQEIYNMLQNQQDVLLFDRPNEEIYPLPSMLRNTKYVGVGRVFADPTDKRAINMFVVADNLLRGAAYNAFEILQRVTQCKN